MELHLTDELVGQRRVISLARTRALQIARDHGVQCITATIDLAKKDAATAARATAPSGR